MKLQKLTASAAVLFLMGCGSKSEVLVQNMSENETDTIQITVSNNTLFKGTLAKGGIITLPFTIDKDSHYEIIRWGESGKDTAGFGYVTPGLTFNDTLLIYENMVMLNSSEQ